MKTLIQLFYRFLVFLGLRKPDTAPDTSPIKGFRPSVMTNAKREKMMTNAKRVTSRNVNYILKHRAKLWKDSAAIKALANA